MAKGVGKAREPQKRAQASQSVFLSPDQVLQATSKERWTPGLLQARTMRKDSVAFSHVRSGSLAAGSYFRMHQRRQLTGRRMSGRERHVPAPKGS